MSFNHACPDLPAPVIADSAALLGPVWIGAGVVLAQGAVVRSHEATVSIDNHSAVLENSSVIGTSNHPVAIGQRTVRHRCQVIGPDRQPVRGRQRLDPYARRRSGRRLHSG